MAVRGGAHDRFSGDIAAGAWPVLDNERPAEPVGEPLRNDARNYVGPGAGRRRHD
jgi:hypothetical protein